jgi:hypothetical protein
MRAPASDGAHSAANPKFALRWGGALSEFRVQSHTSKPLISSVVLDLKLLNAEAIQMAGVPPRQSPPSRQDSGRLAGRGQ